MKSKVSRRWKGFSLFFVVLMVLQSWCFCPCTYAAYNRLMEVLNDGKNLTVEDIKPIVEGNPEFVKETYNGKNKKGKTVIYYALCKGENTEKNRAAIVRYLGFEKGASVGPMWEGGDTPLHWAIKNDHKECAVSIIVAGASLKQQDKDGKTPMQLAKESRNFDMVNRLSDVQSRLDNSLRQEFRKESIIYANVEYCLKRGANPNIVIEEGVKKEAPLHIAVMNNNFEIVKLLLDNGANPDIKVEECGYTPLWIAAFNEKLEDYDACLELLLQRGANPNIDTKVKVGCEEGSFPLFYATFCGYENGVKLLLDYGADPNLLTYSGIAPLDICERIMQTNDPSKEGYQVYSRIAELLKKKGGRTNAFPWSCAIM